MGHSYLIKYDLIANFNEPYAKIVKPNAKHKTILNYYLLPQNRKKIPHTSYQRTTFYYINKTD